VEGGHPVDNASGFWLYPAQPQVDPEVMARDPVILAAYVMLSLWMAATLLVGALYHFSGDGDRYQPWVFPMCMITFAGALIVDRLRKRRGQR
jgi:hypothetical protein